ncbi:hypothetical protein EM858_17345 [Agrobacterium sp. CNPSo 2736]|nr:hypothetical protein EM858_17345 [Agrobacterium sp. CNPSo 2736]
MGTLSRAGKDWPTRTLSKPRQTALFRPLSPSRRSTRRAPGLQPGASFRFSNAATPPADTVCRTAFPPAAIHSAASSADS